MLPSGRAWWACYSGSIQQAPCSACLCARIHLIHGNLESGSGCCDPSWVCYILTVRSNRAPYIGIWLPASKDTEIQRSVLKYTENAPVSSNLTRTVSWSANHHHGQWRTEYTGVEIRIESPSDKWMGARGTVKLQVLSTDLLGLLMTLVTDLLESRQLFFFKGLKTPLVSWVSTFSRNWLLGIMAPLKGNFNSKPRAGRSLWQAISGKVLTSYFKNTAPFLPNPDSFRSTFLI